MLSLGVEFVCFLTLLLGFQVGFRVHLKLGW